MAAMVQHTSPEEEGDESQRNERANAHGIKSLSATSSHIESTGFPSAAAASAAKRSEATEAPFICEHSHQAVRER